MKHILLLGLFFILTGCATERNATFSGELIGSMSDNHDICPFTFLILKVSEGEVLNIRVANGNYVNMLNKHLNKKVNLEVKATRSFPCASHSFKIEVLD